MAHPLLDKLNPEQRRAVEVTEGPVLVLAGAGTGKTRVITHRIAYLLAQGHPPQHVLAMTFTNKAAGEMRERVGAMVSRDKAKDLTIGTFHAFCVRFLRRHAEAVGLPGGFAIADESDQLSAVKGVLRELRFSEDAMKPEAVLAKISLAKNRLQTYGELLDSSDDERDQIVGRAWKSYDEALRRSRTLDFDDLLVFTLSALKGDDALRERTRERFRYVMVDEYQDTNGVQYEIVRQIAGGHRNLCVVGDDDQSIYGWRGADVRKILEFEKHFPGAVVVRLERNYRSTAQILDAANAVIRNNPTRHDKSLRSELGPGEPVLFQVMEDEEDEAEQVVKEIVTAAQSGRARYSDFAILFRTAVQPRAFEAKLRAKNVPYVLVGGMSFFDRKEVKDVIAFLKLVQNPDDEMSLLRVVNVPPRGVGATTVDRVLEYATAHGISAGKAFDEAEKVEGLPPAAVAAVQTLRAKLRAMGDPEPGQKLVEILRRLIREVSYADEIQRNYPDPRDADVRWAAVMEVVNFAENYVRRRGADATLAGFLEELTLNGQEDKNDKDAQRRDCVTLMTLHAAKGLEFPRVFLVGCEEGILPHQRSVAEDTVEEERRLMYVGVTRAQRRLTVSFCEERAKYGRRSECMPSRFVFEIQGKSPPPGWRAAGSKDAAPRDRPPDGPVLPGAMAEAAPESKPAPSSRKAPAVRRSKRAAPARRGA
jgi:DNA helicase-2/ATP-dependent DNA helicase PcrA